MPWYLLAAVIGIYFLGFYLGRKYEQAEITEGVVGVLASINKYNDHVETVTYYYSQAAYDEKIKELKEQGEEYYE